MINDKNKVRVTTHKIYSTDNLEMDAFLFEPSKQTDKIIIHIHGKEGHFMQNHFILDMGYTYPKHGYSFLTFNNRGHDYIADIAKKSAQGYTYVMGGSAYDIFEDCIFDIDGVVNYVRDLGYREIILQGHSLGPHKICYYMHKKSNHNISKVVLISLSDILFLLNSEVPNWEQVAGIAKQMIDEGKGKDIMAIRLWSNCPVSADTFWNYTRPDSNTYCFNYSQPQIEFRHFENIEKPILAITPETDFSMGRNNEKNISLLKERTKSKDFKPIIIKQATHSFAGKEKELISEIINWLNGR